MYIEDNTRGLIIFLTTFIDQTVSCPMSIATKPAYVGISTGGIVTREAIIPTIANRAIQLPVLLRPSAHLD